jgi:hypothetical protein
MWPANLNRTNPGVPLISWCGYHPIHAFHSLNLPLYMYIVWRYVSICLASCTDWTWDKRQMLLIEKCDRFLKNSLSGTPLEIRYTVLNPCVLIQMVILNGNYQFGIAVWWPVEVSAMGGSTLVDASQITPFICTCCWVVIHFKVHCNRLTSQIELSPINHKPA